MARKQHTRNASGPAGPSQRQLRAGELIRHALVDILREEEIHDETLAGVSITVTMSKGPLTDSNPSNIALPANVPGSGRRSRPISSSPNASRIAGGKAAFRSGSSSASSSAKSPSNAARMIGAACSYGARMWEPSADISVPGKSSERAAPAASSRPSSGRVVPCTKSSVANNNSKDRSNARCARSGS